MAKDTPTTHSARKPPGRGAYPETLWVECPLTDHDKEHLRAEEFSAQEIIEGITALVSSGYKLSISFDERSDAVGAYLTAPKQGSSNRVVCLSARAPFLEAALAVLLYKHYTKLKEDWGGKAEEKAVRDSWG